jgi:uncharacterized protein YneF (UPF0154 family)
MSMSIWWFVLVIVVSFGLGVAEGWMLHVNHVQQRSRPDLTPPEPDE